MSNSARHREKRRIRAKLTAKENRIYRNAGRRKHFMTQEIPKETVLAEIKKQKSIFQKAKEYIRRVVNTVAIRSKGN